MTTSNSDAFSWPLPQRVRHGAQRGALVGVYVFALTWLTSVLGASGNEHIVDNPVTAAAAITGGFVLGGIALLVLGPRVRNLAGSIGLATACLIPALFGLFAGVRGFVSAVIPGAVVLAAMLGAIWGTISWKRRHR